MAKQRLTVAAIPPPPVETTIVPRTGSSVKGSSRSLRRRYARSKLYPHFFVVYPLPPASPEFVTKERPKLAAVQAARATQRRKPRVLFVRDYGVVYPLPPSLFLPTLGITLAPSHGPKTSSALRKPVVVGAASPQAINDVLAVQLARTYRTRTTPRYVYPIVVFRVQALGGTAINLVRIWPPSTYSRLSPPVVVNP